MTRNILDLLESDLSDFPGWDIADSLERQVVFRGGNQPQVTYGVLDFLSLEKPDAAPDDLADSAVHKGLFNAPREIGGAIQYRNVGIGGTVAFQLHNLLCNPV